MMPGLREWVFSAKTFASAMIALYIAFRMDLDRPCWAMMTVYVVAQPLTGAMRSKSLYRFAGTAIGAVVAIALVPNLVAAPFLLTAALALFVGLCIYFALLDRTPRSYLFLLAGFTAAIIGLPSVDAPQSVFATAIARLEETTLAIGCTTVIGAIVFPRPLGPALLSRIDAWFGSARSGCIAVLSGRPDDEAFGIVRRSLAADAVEIRMLTTHLAFDTSNLQAATQPIGLLERRILLLFPVLSAIGDYLAALRTAGGISPGVQALTDRLAAWVSAADSAPQQEAAQLHAEIEQAEPPIGPNSGWDAIVLTALLVRLRDLTDIVHDARALRRQVENGDPQLPQLALPHGVALGAARYRDHGMALLSGLSAALTVGVICAFWIASAWPAGGVAAMMAAVGCSFFAAQDDPAPMILQFLRLILIALTICAAYLFVVLPMVDTYAMMMLVFAPTFLVLGVMIAVPATNFTGMAIAANVAGLLSLADVYNADFTTFANNSLATVVGMGTAATFTRIVRSVGAVWSARRLLRANRRDLARVAASQGAFDQPTLTALIIDRLCELAPRLAASDAHADKAVADALIDLRIGLNVLNLQRDSAALPAGARVTIARTLEGVAGHFRHRASRRADDTLRADIDRAIVAVTSVSGARTRNLLLELVGIRHNLFPNAPPYQPHPDMVHVALPAGAPA